MNILLKIPLPKNLLSEGNKNDHWSKKHKRNKRRAQWLCAYWKIDENALNLPCVVKFTRIAPYALDEDNMGTSMKYFRDWIADKIIPGLAPGRADGDKRITWHYAQEKGAVKEYALKIELIS